VAAAPARAGTLKCPPDSVKVGTNCIDTYEASVWQIDPVANKKLVDKVQAGKATLADLTKGGATQLGAANGAPFASCDTGYPLNFFPYDGNWKPVPGSSPPSPGLYAVSVPGVRPSSCITWFMADQACLLSGKRLLTNREWQGAAAGTPDPGTDNLTTDCAVNSPSPVSTGSRSSCKSSWGVFDMVGNLEEWVADWADRANRSGCTDWTSQTGIPGGDSSCFGGNGSDASTQIPGALIRGGSWLVSDSAAGVFAVDARFSPSMVSKIDVFTTIGFRCAR
jgi:formylglycine-generating enzyme required for sulfatase activity